MIDISKKHNIDGLTIYSQGILGKENKEMSKIKEKTGQIDKPQKVRKAWIWISIVLAILILAGLGTWLVIKKPTFLGSKVNISLSVPKEAVSGTDFSFTIEYSNGEDVDLEDVEIKAFYPEGFEFTSSEPKNQEATFDTWKFDRIQKGESGKITIQGKLLGDLNSEKKWKAIITYKPKNVSSHFSKETEAVCKINSSALTVLSELQNVAASGEEIAWTIKYSNTEKNDIANIKIEAIYPDGFEFQEAKPKASRENNLWENLTLGANEEAELVIKGKLSGNLDESKTLTANIGVVDSKGKFWPQQKIENSVKIIEANLEINQTQDKETANPGDLIEYKATLKNTGSVAIENIVITNEIDTKFLDAESIQVENAKFEEQKIVWNKDTLEQLASLEPEKEVQISFKVKVIQNIKTQNTEDKNFVIKNKVKIEGEVEGKKTSWESSELNCKIATLVSLKSEAHFVDYEGIQVGTGPIPPEVGKTTSYLIYWQAGNQTNDVEKAKVIAVLPEGVTWTGKTTSTQGSLSFDSKTRRVIWDIGSIPAHAGSLLSGLEATFEISITPKTEDVGKVLLLLNESLLQGTDTFCKIKVKDSTMRLDTDLLLDIKAKGKGKVIQSSVQ